MTDRDGRKVSVFAFYYGFCQKYAIEFGRPHGKREFRVYFIERVFDYTSILRRYMERNQEIVCESCGAKYALEHLSALQFFNMKCRECTNGTCRVINLSKRYEVVLQSINQALLLPSAELGILHTLHSEGKALFAAEIASELDCSYQLVGRRGKFLADRGLVERRENETGRRVYELTDVAEESYFSRQEENQLNIDKG